jgi:tetratricopeptide (TPR) repeat protein
VEGVAEAWAEDFVCLPEAHRRQAAALRAGRLPALRQCMGLTGFWTVSEGAAYDTAGSFIGWLVLEHGMEKFRLLDRGLDYERVYGSSLPLLEAEWHAFLSRVEVDPDERASARQQFDPELSPAYVECACPKLGTRTESREEAAERRLSGDYEGALALYRLMLEEAAEPAPRWATSAALCLQRLGRAEEALPLLDSFEMDGLPVEDVDQLLTRRSVSLMAMREWEALYAALDERTARARGSSPERRVTEECLRDPTVRDGVAEALDPQNGSGRIERLEGLANAHPERRCVRYLAEIQRPRASSVWGPLWLDAAAHQRARALLQYVRDDPTACELFSDRLADGAERAIYGGDLDLGEELARGITESCPDPIARHRAARCLAWIERERVGAS